MYDKAFIPRNMHVFLSYNNYLQKHRVSCQLDKKAQSFILSQFLIFPFLLIDKYKDMKLFKNFNVECNSTIYIEWQGLKK